MRIEVAVCTASGHRNDDDGDAVRFCIVRGTAPLGVFSRTGAEFKAYIERRLREKFLVEFGFECEMLWWSQDWFEMSEESESDG